MSAAPDGEVGTTAKQGGEIVIAAVTQVVGKAAPAIAFSVARSRSRVPAGSGHPPHGSGHAQAGWAAPDLRQRQSVRENRQRVRAG